MKKVSMAVVTNLLQITYNFSSKYGHYLESYFLVAYSEGNFGTENLSVV